MKKIVLFMLMLVGSGQIKAHKNIDKRSSGNPMFPGWYADPEAAVFNKQYWVYPAYSAPYEQQVFMDAFSSPDLVHWTKHPHVLDSSAVKWARRAMWAPAITKKDGKYYLFFGANDIQGISKNPYYLFGLTFNFSPLERKRSVFRDTLQNDQQTGGIGVAVADRPEGPFKDYLGKPLIGKIVNGAQPIDQFVFKDHDGQYYIIYGGWGHCNMAKLNASFTGFIPFADGITFKSITPKDYVEGPVLFTRKNKYYLMWSEGGWGGPDYRVAYAMADSVDGLFTRIGTVLK